jgi:predicted nucleic acid-binding protein
MSVIRWLVATSVLSENDGRDKAEELFELPIRINTSLSQFSVAYDWAIRAKRIKMHDLQYIAVAQMEHAQILTLDGGMRQAALEHNVPVSLLR